MKSSVQFTLIKRMVCATAIAAMVATPAVAAEQAKISAPFRRMGAVQIPGQPGFDSAIFANGYLLLTRTTAGTVDVFDPVKRRIVAQVKGMQAPRGLAVDAKTGQLFVAQAGTSDSGPSIAVVSTKDWQLQRTIPVKDQPYSLMFVPEWNKLAVANSRANTLSLIDGESGQAQQVALGGSPQSMDYDATRQVLVTTLLDRNEVVSVANDGRVATRFKVTGSQPAGVLVNEKSRKLFVAVRHAVLVLNANDGAEVGRIPAAAGVNKLWMDDAGGALFASAGDGTLQTIRQQGDRWVSTGEMRAPVRGALLAFDSANGLVYVPGGIEGRSQLVILKPVSYLMPQTDGIEAARK